MHSLTNRIDRPWAVNQLARTLLDDAWTLRLFLALVVFDLLFIAIVAAKAFAFIRFDGGFGNLIIAAQLILVAAVLGTGWFHNRNPAMASLTAVATLLAAEKVFKFHALFSVRASEVLMSGGLNETAGHLIGSLLYIALFGVLAVAILRIGWQGSDRNGRAAMALLVVAFAVMAGTSVVADAFAGLLRQLTSIGLFNLARGEQGLELITVSALLALTVGVVRVGWRNS